MSEHAGFEAFDRDTVYNDIERIGSKRTIVATAHTFLATDADLPLILDWLKAAGAVPVIEGVDVTDFGATGNEIALYFPALGKLEYWKDPVAFDEFPENSARWRDSFFARLKQQENRGRKIIDSNKTPSAGLKLPEFRDNL